MSTFKVLLDKRRQLKNGSYPLIVRIFNGKEHSAINLNIRLMENEFDSSTQKVIVNHPCSKLINLKIQKTVLEVQQAILRLEIDDEVVTSSIIKARVVKPKPKLSFTQFGYTLIEQMQTIGRVGNASSYRCALTALKTYSGLSDIQFKEFSYGLLCLVENKMLAAGLKKNSIAAYNRALRAIFNRAINEELVEFKFYPFRKFKIKGETTAKRNISKEQIKAIAEMQLIPQSQLWHSRNYFTLSFNLRGMSFTDMASIKPEDILNGRLVYRRKKTHKLYNIKLTETAKEIITEYHKPGARYILPVLADHILPKSNNERLAIQQAIKVCNKYLERIAEELKLPVKVTTYFARHSWATTAKKMGYSKELISESLGHSFGNKITESYLDSFDQEVIDKMNEEVCKF